MIEHVRHGRDRSGAVCTVLVEGGMAATPLHAHQSLILCLVDKGARQLSAPAGRFTLGPGDGFVIPPDTPHAWAATTEGTHRVIVLDCAAFQFPAWQAGPIHHAAWTKQFDVLFASATKRGVDARHIARNLLALTERFAIPGAKRQLVAKPVLAARREISKQLGENLGLAELGRRVGLSPYHLHRLYRQSWGLSPAEHRLEARLRQARRLILAGSAIAAAAIATGFADQSHFNRAFRRLMGIPPGQWARQMISKDGAES